MKYNIISTYHHGFAGGSKNTSRLLHYLSQNECNVDAYFFDTPQFFTYTKSPVRTHVFDSDDIHSEVIDFNLLKNYSLTDKIIQKIKQTPEPILFGANLFPFCNILLDAKNQIKRFQQSEPKLFVHPVGSDIWSVGKQIKSRVKWLIDHPSVNCVITYSESFITEIKEYFNIQREIYILPPVLEKKKFFPLNATEVSERRKALGLNDDCFVINHHSSMRKIKCPEIVLEIAKSAAQIVSEKCVLIMTGPIPNDVIISMNLSLVKTAENNVFTYKTELKNLTIYWTGVLSNVEFILQISDCELNASMHDSFNISLMESMACAVPVVTSDVVGIRQHVEKSNGGYCFPVKRLNFDELNDVLNSGNSIKDLFDIDYAVNAIVTIANDRATARLQGEAAAEYVAEQFSLEKISTEFYKHINK